GTRILWSQVRGWNRSAHGVVGFPRGALSRGVNRPRNRRRDRGTPDRDRLDRPDARPYFPGSRWHSLTGSAKALSEAHRTSSMSLSENRFSLFPGRVRSLPFKAKAARLSRR